MVAGGVTASCSSDAPVHSLTIGGSSWTSTTPSGFLRRHGAAAAAVDNDVLVVGGIVDNYVCYSGESFYAAFDRLSVPVSSASATSSALPAKLTGTSLAVSDFGLANSNGKVYLVGGQDSKGSLVSLDTIGVWSSSTGWTSQATTGNVPAGRLGATLVAHPKADALVLYGGSTLISSTTFSASNVVAVLNTTTWEWSVPQNVQPGSSAAVSYHSSVVTPSGVMISAFGRSSSGSPIDTVSYLDMRDPSSNKWGWASSWDKDMLNSYIAPSSAVDQGKHKSNKSTITAAVVPTIFGSILLVVLGLWLYRRHQKNSRQRRLASHFSFSAQEDRGDFSRPLDQYEANRRNRYPFGNPSGASSQGSLTSLSRRIMTVFRKGTKGVGDDGTIHEGQMIQVSPEQLNEKGMNWEEIDFGLGRVDASRTRERNASYTNLPSRTRTPRPRDSFAGPPERIPFPMPVASTISYPEPEEETGPATGELVRLDTDSPRLGTPLTDGQIPLMSDGELSVVTPGGALADAGADAAAHTEANDWSMLEQSMMSRPIFSSPSPNSSLRKQALSMPPAAHVPPSPTHSTSSVTSSAPSLPPLQFSNTPLTHGRNVSGTSTRFLGGGRRQSQSQADFVPPTMASRRSSTSVSNALGLNRMSRLHVANPSDDRY